MKLFYSNFKLNIIRSALQFSFFRFFSNFSTFIDFFLLIITWHIPSREQDKLSHWVSDDTQLEQGSLESQSSRKRQLEDCKSWIKVEVSQYLDNWHKEWQSLAPSVVCTPTKTPSVHFSCKLHLKDQIDFKRTKRNIKDVFIFVLQILLKTSSIKKLDSLQSPIC